MLTHGATHSSTFHCQGWHGLSFISRVSACCQEKRGQPRGQVGGDQIVKVYALSIIFGLQSDYIIWRNDETYGGLVISYK